MKFSKFELKAPTNYGPIAAGLYDVTVSSCEWKENSLHTGEIISVKFTIIGPTYNNRNVFANFNIKNASARAEEIGQQQMSDFARACGFNELPDDTDDFVGRNLTVKIGVEPSDKVEPGKDPRNIILSYRTFSGESSAPAPQEQAPTRIGTGAVPPWLQKKS